MNKKILGIIASSAAAIGSAIIASPAHAQTAPIDVELEVQPSVYLVTYNKLKFLVNSNDILGSNFLNNTAVYDEKLKTTTLPEGQLPSGSGGSVTPVNKTVAPLYRVFANSGATVTVETDMATLRRTGAGASPSDTVTMAVTAGATKTIAPNQSNFVPGDATLQFTFPGPSAPAAGAVYSGGKLKISVVSP